MKNTPFFDSLPAAHHWKKIGMCHHHGVTVPLSSIHSKKSCGIGEFFDLIPMIDWCKSVGFSLLQLLPLNDTGTDPSPYNALSSCALNPVYLSLSTFEGIDDLSSLKQLTKEKRVPYQKIYQEKQELLKQWIEKNEHNIIIDQNYHEFVSSNEWVAGYALFKVLKKQFKNKDWRSWDTPFKEANLDTLNLAIDKYATEIKQEMIAQYLCHQQLVKVHDYAASKGVHLLGDLPILLSPDSADVWLAPAYFDTSLGAGAPPDNYSKKGQNWGFPLYDWNALKAYNYDWWQERLKTAERYYQMYRLDHVVGFYRIWAVPHGKTGLHGTYIPNDSSKWIQHGEQILNTLLETSSALPFGEDLGTIPKNIKSSLQNLGIPGIRVMRWEREWDKNGALIPINDYDPLSMTTVSTHDSETVSDWWENYPKEAHVLCDQKGWRYKTPIPKKYLFSILSDSHKSSSFLHCNLLQEYLALHSGLTENNPKDDRINTPNTVSNTNWTYRYLPSIEKICDHQPLQNSIRSLIGS